MSKKILSLILAGFFVLGFTACDDDDDEQNLVEIIQSRSELSTLAFLVGFIDANADVPSEAQLGNTLSNSLLSYTAFLPNNAAFAELDQNEDGAFDQQDVDILVNAVGVPFRSEQALATALYALVANHVVSGAVTSDELTDGQELDTLVELGDLGSNFGLEIVIANDVIDVIPSFTPFVGEVVTANIEASNGVAHIVDSVLMDFDTAELLGLVQP